MWWLSLEWCELEVGGLLLRQNSPTENNWVLLLGFPLAPVGPPGTALQSSWQEYCNLPQETTGSSSCCAPAAAPTPALLGLFTNFQAAILNDCKGVFADNDDADDNHWAKTSTENLSTKVRHLSISRVQYLTPRCDSFYTKCQLDALNCEPRLDFYS